MLDNLHQQFTQLLGSKNWVTTTTDLAPYLSDSRGRFIGQSLGMALPSSTDEVVKIVNICRQAGVSIVTQGGNTGRCGGATPDSSGQQVLLNLKRMQHIRQNSINDNVLIVEAGCILGNIHTLATQMNRQFPVHLGAEGSCQIGGILATNAGGLNVLRYGMARDLCLGLEVVLASGEILDDLRIVRKDNSGYDLKNLFIGSEGSLGIITAAALKLHPLYPARQTAMVALDTLDQAIALFNHLQQCCQGQLIAFELISQQALQTACSHLGVPSPFSHGIVPTWSVLIEEELLDETYARLSTGLLQKLDQVQDVLIAQTLAQTAKLWHLREAVVLGQAHFTASLKHDICLPLSQMSAFFDAAHLSLNQFMAGANAYVFGHLGDGNLHYNITPPTGMSRDIFLAHQPQIAQRIYDLVQQHQGSFAAEHGIGRMKVADLQRYKSPVAWQLMQQLKHTLDPNKLLNPNVVLPVDSL